MQKFSLKLLLSVSLMVLGVAFSAQAVPFMLPSNTPVYFQFNNLEQIDLSLRNTLVMPDGYNGNLTQGNWGVFNLSSIQLGGASTPHREISGGEVIWADGAAYPGQIHGVFGGINLDSGTKASGGWMDIYYTEDSINNITAADLSGSLAIGITKFVAGTFLARLNFMPGVITGDAVTTIKSNTDLTSPEFVSGQSDSFADVDLTKVGLWTSLLDGNWFNVNTDGDTQWGEANEKRDVRFSTWYSALPAGDDPDTPEIEIKSPWTDPTNGILGVKSNDPGRVFTVVPEPGSILLLGVGLLGFAGALRRKSI